MEKDKFMVSTIDEIISASLSQFATDLLVSKWTGCREREVVSLYSFGYLIQRAGNNSFLVNPTQIGLDVAVPQIDKDVQLQLSGRESAKDQVCKDIVIWPEPRMTCWDSSGKPKISPAAILEWKYDEPEVCKYDVGWLRQFSIEHSDFVGYAITVDPKKRNFYLSCTRLQNGTSKESWLFLD